MSKEVEAALDEKIAIIGFSSILPGAENACESWDVIRNSIDALSDIPADRIDISAYYHPNKTEKDKIYCKRGGFIPPFDFNPREFNFNMLQMEDTDVNQTLTLLKVKEALQDAGINASPQVKKNIGVVLGIGGGQKASHEFYSRLNYVVVDKVLRSMGLPEKDVEVAVAKYKANFPEWRLDSFPGFLGNVSSGRVTNVFNLDGMNCVVDAACASSLTALKVAIDELLHGDCRTMITGATCTDNSIGMFMAFSKTPVFSKNQSLMAYDKDTGGMLIGEGSVMFVIKRLSHAIEDGDTIHAVLRGVASSSDGKAPGIYAPTIEGQELALKRAWAKAGVDPSTVTMVEGHGTGTPVGDAIELTALANVFGAAGKDRHPESIAVGSIKANIGHLKACAGFAGLLKVVLSLKHKSIPPSINMKNPLKLRDGRSIQETLFYINTMHRPWFTRGGLPRRAGVSSFGFGGANYHCVVEEYEPEHTKPYRMHQLPQPILLHAKGGELSALVTSQIKVLAEGTEAKNADKRSLASLFNGFTERFQLNGKIPADDARVGFVAIDATQALDVLRSIEEQLRSKTDKPWALPKIGAYYRPRALSGKLAALFSDQGSQYTYMFTDTALNWPPFRVAVENMDRAVEESNPKAAIPSEVLYPRARYASESAFDEAVISQSLHAQTTTVACSVGSYDIFVAAGLKPDFTGGHNLGELTARLVARRASMSKSSQNATSAFAASVRSIIPSFSNTDTDAKMGSASFEDQIKTMYDAGCRVFVEFGPQKKLTELVESCLPSHDIEVVAINPSKERSSDLQIREAAVRLGVAGIPLSNFDPWSVANPFHKAKLDTKGVVSLTAATFVSAKTLRERQAILEDGYSLSKDDEVSKAAAAQLQQKLQNLEQQLAQARADASSAKEEAESVRRALAATEAVIAAQVAANNSPQVAAPTVKPAPEAVLGYHGPEPPAQFMKWGLPKGQPSKCTWHPLAGVDGNPTPGFQPTAFPPRAICFRPFPGNPNDRNHVPGQLPLSWVNLCEFMCNKVSLCLGDEFKRFDDSTTSRSPAFDLQLVTRVLSVTDTEKGNFFGVDVNPSKGTMVAEFDCPEDAWFYKENSQPGLMPYSMLMEIGLQTSGILTSWVKAPLTMNLDNILFRNLDATGTLVRNVDLRGKTISNMSKCTGYSMLGPMGIHRFYVELSVDGEPFYKITTSFGWFTPEAFQKQAGLDNGKTSLPWHEQKKIQPSSSYSLPNDEPMLFAKYPTLQRKSQQLYFLDHLSLIPSSGEFGSGYVHGSKQVNKKDWFFSCHFWCDPVMPGSLGIEGMFQCIEFFCAGTDQAKGFNNPQFNHVLGETVWKYRGQLTPKNDRMDIEVHIKSITKEEGKVIVVADGWLSVDRLRVYQAKGLRLSIEEAPTPKKPLAARAIVLAVLSDKTGYEVDLIEEGMSLEEELGIDSIKRVEILSAVQDKLGVEAKDVEALSQTRTVGEVIAAMSRELGVVIHT